MALKFLNKKGWHTGSLRNIENVWKAEQKHNAEQSKLEELRKQIQEEREKAEFRQLQEQAGLVPRQERLDFLYESGLAVGKGSSDGFKALEAPTASAAAATATSEVGSDEAGSSKAAVPGALFEDKPQSANDAWRKLHSDPLLLIRQREQEALARIKNNPIQMALIRKSAEAEKKNKKDKGKLEKKRHKSKHHHKLKNEENSDSENTGESEDNKRDRPTSEKRSHTERKRLPEDSIEGERLKHSKRKQPSEEYSRDDEEKRRSNRGTSHRHSQSKHEKSSSRIRSDSKYLSDSDEDRRRNGRSESEHRGHRSHRSSTKHSSENPERDDDRRKHSPLTSNRYCYHYPSSEPRSENIKNKDTQTESRAENIKNKQPQTQQGPGYNRRKGVPKMTEEEREARLREMQENAELHEEQRWKRIKKADENDARELARAKMSSGGKNFLDDAQKSIFGTEKGGSTTIEESVRRRAYYSQGRSKADETNAFRR